MHQNKTDRTISLNLIKEAQQGQGNSRSVLSDLARGKIFVYIYRITQNYHLAEDLCQETMVSLTESIEKLKITNTAGFRAWLYRTALGKVQRHYRSQGNKRIDQNMIVDSDRLTEMATNKNTGGLNKLVHDELMRAVSSSIATLKLSYRNILTLRCFDGLSYREIAQIQGGTQLKAKMQFFRAKQALKRQLCNSGFNESYLLAGLGLFGSVTAGVCKQAAASVTKSCLFTSPMTVATAAITSKVGIMIVASALVTSAVTSKVIHSQYQKASPTFNALMQDVAFDFPSSIVAAHDPDQDGWVCTYTVKPETHPNSSPPDEILIGKMYMYGHCLLLPKDHWVEVGFSGPIIDEAGPDLFFAGWGCRSLHILVTNGAGQTYELPRPACINQPHRHHTLSFDLSGHTIGFEPRAIRVYGRDVTNQYNGFQLNVVKARVRQ